MAAEHNRSIPETTPETKGSGTSGPAVGPDRDHEQGDGTKVSRDGDEAGNPKSGGSAMEPATPIQPQAETEKSRDSDAGPGGTVWTLRSALERLRDEEYPQASYMIQNHVRNDSKLVWKAARTGIIEVWRVVVDAIEAGGGNLLEKALMATETQETGQFSLFGAPLLKSAITEAVASESPAMVEEVLACAKTKLPQHQVTDLVQNAGLLMRAAQAGAIETWRIVFEELRGRGLLEEALNSTDEKPPTVVMSAVESMQPAMVNEVIKCVREHIPNRKVKSLLLASSGSRGSVLHMAAAGGNIGMWTTVVDVLKGEGVLEEACTNRSIRGTVVMKAIESKQPAMFKEVVNCVRECIPDQQVKSLLQASDVMSETVLHVASKGGNIGMWTAVVDVLKGEGLLEEALETKGKYGETVVTNAVKSEQPAMVMAVVHCVRECIPDRQKVKSLLLASSGSRGSVLHMAAAGGNIGMWTAVVDALKGEGLLEEALMKTDNNSRTVLTWAVYSNEPVMVKEVVDCMRENVPDQQKVAEGCDQELLHACRPGPIHPGLGALEGLKYLEARRYLHLLCENLKESPVPQEPRCLEEPESGEEEDAVIESIRGEVEVDCIRPSENKRNAPRTGLRRLFAPLGRLWSRATVRRRRQGMRKAHPKVLERGSLKFKGGNVITVSLNANFQRSPKLSGNQAPPPAIGGASGATIISTSPIQEDSGEQVMAGEQDERSGKDIAKIDPPQLQEVLPLMLTFLDSRSWCECLSVSPPARDAVRALFSGLMPDGPRPEEGWTVPLDVLTLKTDEAGVPHLAANECGITIRGSAENLANLKAVIIPPPPSGFVTVEGEQYIATSPILRCRWTGNDSSQGPWTVSFPLEEEDGMSNPTELSRVLRRGDDLHDDWEVQAAGLKASPRHPSMKVEVTHFSDVMTADKLRDIEKRSTSSYYKRKRVWGATIFSRCVHVYNASAEAMTVLQVLPAVMESGRGVQLSLPLVGGGGGGNRDITIHDDQSREARQVAAWKNALNDSGTEPPTDPAKFETLLGMKAMRVVPYTVTGSREASDLKVFPRDFFHCSAGYDFYLLQKMVDGSLRHRFWKGDVGVDMSEERRVMDIVNK